MILRKTSHRSVTEPAIPRREIDPSIFDAEKIEYPLESKSNGSLPRTREHYHVNDTWVGQRTGRPRPKLTVALSMSPKDYLVSRTLLMEDVRKPKDVVHRLEGIGKVGEYLHVIRPLIYGE